MTSRRPPPGDSAAAGEPLINGVPVDQYGTWCSHGHRVMAPDPTDTSQYPTCRFVDPWPCPHCSQAEMEQHIEDEEAAWEADRWADYRSAQ